MDNVLIKIIMNILMIFHTLTFCKYLDENLDRQPKQKKNKKEAIDAPTPKKYFCVIKKFLEKFPRKKTVSE